MGQCFLHGNGGSNPLNFRVLNGTSAPSNPKKNDIWVNTNTDIHAWDFSAKEPHRKSNNKNVFVHPYYHATRTINGITYTDNGDGTITANGTATSSALFRICNDDESALLVPPGTYVLSGCPSVSGCQINVLDNDSGTVIGSSIAGTPGVITVTKDTSIRANLSIDSGSTVSDIVFKPQLEKGSTATSFVKGDATGHVWFKTGSESAVEFNALKKNGLQVYPVSAKQYVSGAWSSVDFSVYSKGAWNDSTFWIIEGGVPLNPITTVGLLPAAGSSGNKGTCTVTQGDNETIFFYTASSGSGAVALFGMYDLSSFDSITYTGTGTDLGYTELYLAVWSSDPAVNGNIQTDRVCTVSIPLAFGETVLDVSSLTSGYYYVGLSYSTASSFSHSAQSVKME